MRKELHIHTESNNSFKLKLLHFGNQFNPFVFLDTHNYYKYNKSGNSYIEYDFLAAIGSLKEITKSDKNEFERLSEFNKSANDWLFGYLTYDLKNDTEKLSSNNIDELNFASIHFFVPEFLFISRDNKISVLYHEDQCTKNELDKLISDIETFKIPNTTHKTNIKLNQRYAKQEYIETVKKLKNHIQHGDIYEVNFCQEFYSFSNIDPINNYLQLMEISPTPFSCYYKLKNNFLLSASPERFLKKKNKKVVSQPIKGTIKRSADPKEDELLKEKLRTDPKERAENVMIVDLVRNDLSRTASLGSVKVEELYGIYSFKQVHQMISTIVSKIDKDTDIIEVIKNAFPMGSMTGAPKIRAMQLIEDYEKTKRGLYSGSVGYITPDKDFDFNVVIRSILYNQKKNYVSFTVGGAITSLADPENEYDECMLKAEAMLKVFK